MLYNKCISCGGRAPLNTKDDFSLCDNCNKLYFSKVKKYINEHGSASINEMHKELGIPIVVLNKFLEDDRLFDPKQQESLRKERERILEQRKKERERQETIKKLINSMEQEPQEEQEYNGIGMHFIDKGRKR